jgi:hypothetical protein
MVKTRRGSLLATYEMPYENSSTELKVNLSDESTLRISPVCPKDLGNDDELVGTLQPNFPETPISSSASVSPSSSFVMYKTEQSMTPISKGDVETRTMREFASGRFSGGIPSKSSIEKLQLQQQQQQQQPRGRNGMGRYHRLSSSQESISSASIETSGNQDA